ncbi:MAG: FkbM family methyltransferase [Phycisphaeraceae bacterium]|nr:FkbM family methyltransferase [Phycisphaeraceae bacterium]
MMPITGSRDTRMQYRRLQMAEIESRWPEEIRQRPQTDEGDNRVYSIWRKTVLTGLFDHLWIFLDPTKAAVDVGALLGQYSLTLATCSTRCLCIEPLENYRFVGRMLPPNCIHRTVAAGERPGQAIIRSPEIPPDGSVDFGLSSLVRQDWPAGYTFRSQPTEVRPLDDIIPEALGDEPIGFIKIDVEGYELPVLRGARATLAKHQPAVLVEVGQENLPQVKDFLVGLGYRGLFFFQRRLYDLSQFRADIHCAPEHLWSPERRDTYDPDMIASDPFFIPARSSC